MELYQLEYFVEVARQRNFTRASATLHIAQPALSQQMKNLEAELGATLFVRGRRQTLLTEAGRTLLPRAQALLAQAEAARQAVADVAELRCGRLVIAAIPSMSGCWLPEVVKRFRKAHPFIELVLTEGSSSEVTAQVERGVAELGFLQLPLAEDRFEVREVLSEHFVLLVAADHALSGRRAVRVGQLREEPFVFYKGKARETALGACREAGFEPRIACESGELETVRALVAAGLGVALLPELAVQGPLRRLRAVKVREPRIERMLGCIRRRSAPLSAAAAAFTDCFPR
jgi:DNA-binding transcriptional LysR family regulator